MPERFDIEAAKHVATEKCWSKPRTREVLRYALAEIAALHKVVEAAKFLRSAGTVSSEFVATKRLFAALDELEKEHP